MGSDEIEDEEANEDLEDRDAEVSGTHPLSPALAGPPLPHPVDAIPRGAVVDRYVILGQLAAGGTGIVYAAFDPQRDRKIALKLLPIGDQEWDDDPEEVLLRRKAVVERIKASQAVSHPSVVQTYDVSMYEGGVMVAMEFVDGINLRQWMEARDDPFPWPEVLRVFIEAGRGLAGAHGAGVVHGDFKPDNVLMANKGRVCILDFGLATESAEDEPDIDLSDLKDALPGILSTHDDAPPELTAAGPIMGTPAYMAPERHVGAAGDPKTDQFSFCVAFYEALYGERPFRGSRRLTLAEQTIHNRVREAPPDSEVPTWLRAVLLRGLSPRRADRYPSMSALLQDLDRDPTASRRRWLLGIGLAGALGAIAAGVTYLVYFESDRCETDESELRGIWDAPARAELRNVIEGSGRPHAADTWQAVSARLDDWTTKWVILHEQACAATRIRRDADEALLAERWTCLAARLDEVAAFGRVYAATVDHPMIDRAQDVVDGIAFPNDCISPETLQTHAAPPESMRVAVNELQHRERDGWTALRAGNHSLARIHADAVDEGLQTHAFAPLRVDNTLLRGLVARAEGQPGTAEALLHDAAALAAAEGLQQPAARAWLALLDGAADDAARGAERRAWARHAEILAEHLGDDRLQAAVLFARGDIARSLGRAGDALSLYHRGLELLERGDDVSRIELADALARLGALVEASGEFVSAGRYYERVAELRQSRYGSSHPAVAEALEALGRARAAETPPRWDDAYGPLERARAIVQQNELDPRRLGPIELRMARIELGRERPQAAAGLFEAAVEHLQGPPAPDDASANALLEAWRGLGQARLDLRDYAPAAVALQRAVEIGEARPAASGTPIEDGRTQELLAVAWWEDPAQRSLARTAATAALDHYLSAGAAGIAHRQRVRAWLDARRQDSPEDSASPAPASEP